MFPRLRASRRRVIQVARAGPSVRKHGIATLDDTREPHVCHTTGAFYALYTALIVAGAVPTCGDGVRKCSVHAKGNVLDASMIQVYGEMPIRHMIGFHAGERKRIERDHGYSGAAHRFEQPLVHHAAAALRSPRRGSAPP